MEEWVGRLWHRLVTQLARRDHPAAAVGLGEMEKTLGIVLRALGGDGGLRVAGAARVRTEGWSTWRERLAGTAGLHTPASLEQEMLRLPAEIAYFHERGLNRDLYLWLAALAAFAPAAGGNWIVRNQAAVQLTLRRCPGLRPRYRRLVEALIATRPAPADLPADEAARERAIRQALRLPGSITALPPARGAPLPVPLWLYSPRVAPAPVARTGSAAQGNGTAAPPPVATTSRVQAEHTAAPDGEAPFLFPFRAESLLSWAEFVRVNRACDEEADPHAARAAADMERLHVVPDDGRRPAQRIRLDLDLPAPAEDDVVLADGLLLPEWDWRARRLKPDHCRLQTVVPRGARPQPLPERLQRAARRLRSQFATLAPARRWLKGQPEGSELDLDACLRLLTERRRGRPDDGSRLYLAPRRLERDLACLVLADLSQSTDAWIGDGQRVIDVIRDGLLLFGEALTASGDAFAIHGFSSLRRSLVRFHDLKPFAAPFDAIARGRIAALRPGYYTRMGAPIRHATALLERRPAALRLLLILSDGKPHDLDHYEGRYGIEDTRHALMEARRRGIRPFCVTIDRGAASYLPHLFGAGGFALIRQPEELPRELPQLYSSLRAPAGL